jgi:putative autotransporter adhesin-like protein
MTRAGCWAGSLVLLGALLASSGRAEEPAAEPSSSWWSWWKWGNGAFGLSLGGVSYGGGADRVSGSDQLVHQVRAIAGVRAIELHGPISLVLKQGPAEKLTLHTDDNIAPLIETTVDDGLLRIGVRPGASFRTAHAIGATVELTGLARLKALGSGDVTCAQLNTDLLEITLRGPGGVRIDDLHTATLAVLLQGSGDVHLSGSAARQGYVVEGSGDVDAEELAGREVAVRVAGSGDVKVWATQSLSIEIAGSGDVHYHGQPALTKSVHGSGDIIHR